MVFKLVETESELGKTFDTASDKFWANAWPAGGVVGLLEVVHGHQGQAVVFGKAECIVGH